MRTRRSNPLYFIVALVFLASARVARAEDNVGVSYFLPKQVLVLDTAQRTETRRVAIERRVTDSGCDPGAPDYSPTDPPPPDPEVDFKRLCIGQSTLVSRTVAAQLKVVADLEAKEIVLNAPKSALADQKFTVELQSGLLKSVNLSSQGRLGEVLSGIAKFAASVFAFPIPSGQAVAGAQPPSPTACNPFLPPYKNLADAVRLLVSRDPAACDLWKSIAAASDHVEELTEQVRESESKLGGTNEPALSVLITKLKEQRKAVDDGKKQAATIQTVFTAMVDAFTKANELGLRVDNTTFSDVLELHQLPPVDPTASLDPVKLLSDLRAHYAVAADVFERTLVVARLSPMAGGNAPKKEAAKVSACTTDSKSASISFRNAEPVRLQIWAAQTEMEPGSDRPKLEKGVPLTVVRPVAERIETVTHQSQPARCMVFKPSALAKRELVMTFDERGQLTKVDQAADSSAAALAGALAGAATSFRDQYADSVEKLVKIDANERALKLSDLTTQIETLKKQKELLDAQLTTDSATASYDLTLKQRQLEAEAHVLEAESSLETAKATAEQRREIELLKVEVDVLKKELELIKARADLENAKK